MDPWKKVNVFTWKSNQCMLKHCTDHLSLCVPTLQQCVSSSPSSYLVDLSSCNDTQKLKNVGKTVLLTKQFLCGIRFKVNVVN